MKMICKKQQKEIGAVYRDGAVAESNVHKCLTQLRSMNLIWTAENVPAILQLLMIETRVKNNAGHTIRDIAGIIHIY